MLRVLTRGTKEDAVVFIKLTDDCLREYDGHGDYEKAARDLEIAVRARFPALAEDLVRDLHVTD